MARAFGLAEGGAERGRSHVGKGGGSFCSHACFPSIIHHPILNTCFFIAMLVFLSILFLPFCIFPYLFYIKNIKASLRESLYIAKIREPNSGSTAPWIRYSHCDRKTSPLKPLPRRHGFTILTATAKPPLELLPRRRGITILITATAKPPWNHFHGAVDSLFSL